MSRPGVQFAGVVAFSPSWPRVGLLHQLPCSHLRLESGFEMSSSSKSHLTFFLEINLLFTWASVDVCSLELLPWPDLECLPAYF